MSRSAAMGNLTHILMAKFKEGVVVEDIIKGMEKLASEIDFVESFVWGRDDLNPFIMTKGYTHAFLMTFKSKEDLLGFKEHKMHLEFANIFTAAAEFAMIFDFPPITVKAAPADAS